MAESAVNFLIEYMGPLLVDEVKLLKGVRGEARKIRDELESMRALLRDADAKEHSNEGIKTWVRQVRHAACDTEDLLDEFILRIGQYQQNRRGIFGLVHKMARSIKELKARHQIGTQIQDMRIRLSEISKRKDDFNLLNNTDMGSFVNSSERIYDARLAALFTEESQLVGIDGPKAWLIDWLLSTEQRLSTISVVGMGGLGKTTLVKKVYDSQQVKKYYETYAWVTVSETFKKMELFRDMIKQFYEAKQEQAPSRLAEMTDMQLIQVLRDYLQNKRFILVADDVWEVNAWKVLSLAFPALGNGSRVILTMRRRDVASSCSIGPSDHIYQLQPLNPDSAWYLFCRRAFPTATDHETNPTLSPELKKLAKSFVTKCRGLPLAIVTLGGLLATKDQTYAVWEMMHRSLGSELDTDNQLKSMMEILWLSFNDLPYYLKSCFSYLSIFPEDYEIRRAQVILLWKAQGFIEKKEGKTIEEVADSYFYALLSRSLIQVTETEIDGEVISFHIHDLLREIIISKSKEENLNIFSSDEEKIELSDRVRHLSIYHNKGEMVPTCKSSSSSHLRSFFVFGKSGQSFTSSAITSFTGLHLLRVLSITNIYMDSFPQDLTSLLHLRHLNLFNLEVKHLPSSIGKLRNLQTLIIEGTYIVELPVEICKLQRLCHLSVCGTDNAYSVKVPNGIGSLRFLQELRVIQAESGILGELGKLTELRILEIINLKREDGHGLSTSIQKMRHLKYLEIWSDEEIDLHSLAYPPLTLQELVLYGHLKELPHWIYSLQNLRILRLRRSKLEDDPLKFLGSLPNLVVLNIAYNACDGEELCVKDGEHLKLRELSLQNLRGLRKMTVEKGAMPNLEVLSIEDCAALVEAPCWLGHLTNLKKLLMRDMPVPFLESLKSDGGAHRADFIKHIPLVSHSDSQSNSTQKF